VGPFDGPECVEGLPGKVLSFISKYHEGPHHIVLFVLKNVAVPDVLFLPGNLRLVALRIASVVKLGRLNCMITVVTSPGLMRTASF
jgi:hypothetical protein